MIDCPPDSRPRAATPDEPVKSLIELLPAVAFMAVYFIPSPYAGDLYVATLVLMGGSVLQVGLLRLLFGPVERRHWILLGAVLVLGGATVLLQDKRFIMWKPTLVNWVLAAVLVGSQYIGDKNLIQRLLGGAVSMAAAQWRWLNLASALFYFAVGCANLWVAHTLDEAAWVQFRTVGLWVLNGVFLVGVMIFVYRHAEEEEQDAAGPGN